MNLTETVVDQQLRAMGGQVFELGAYRPASPETGEALMIPRVWDRETLLRSIPWLRLQNLLGGNIYIRPRGEHDLSLIDDLSPRALNRMKAEGFHPTAVVETSPNNFQAWLKHPKQLPREISTAAARELARRFDGDLGAADWRHFGRLAGLTNRKRKYESDTGLYPFVRLVEWTGRKYPEGRSFIREVETRLEEEQRHRTATSGWVAQVETARGATKTIDEFRANPTYGGDQTRVDLAYSIYAFAHGATESMVRTAIRSRDLCHKGTEKRQAEYIERTINKAQAIVADRICTR